MLYKEAKRCIHSKVYFKLSQDMIPTTGPEVANLSNFMSYTSSHGWKVQDIHHILVIQKCEPMLPMWLISPCTQRCELPRSLLAIASLLFNYPT